MSYMVVRMRHTKSATNQRRSHHALTQRTFSKCSHCGQPTAPHTLCANCGYFKDRQVVNVLAKLDKKERKKREKELHAHEEAAAEKEGKLSAEELSHR